MSTASRVNPIIIIFYIYESREPALTDLVLQLNGGGQ